MRRTRLQKSRPDNQPSAEECEDRVDCRPHNVITIDPDDAKDFDDAICIQRQGPTSGGFGCTSPTFRTYVRPGSPLDVEARKRGNSTYLVDRVIPMLPEALSNELCSLKPDIDRLTKVRGVPALERRPGVCRRSSIPPSSARKRRFTYKEAFTVLQTRS